MATALSKDSKRLEELESIVERGVVAFYDIGRALREIRDFQLYEKVRGVSSFDIYCKDKWGFHKSVCYNLIGAAELRDNLSAMADILPTNERQARPLISLAPADQQEVWQEVLERAPKNEDGDPLITAKVVKEVRDELFPPEYKEDSDAWDMEHEINEVAKFLTRAWSKWPRESLDLLIVQLQRFATKIEKDMEDGD